MTCINCGSANAPGQKFCGECGTLLARSCPSCGTANAPGQKFCGECGTLLADGAAPAPPRTPVATAPGTQADRASTSASTGPDGADSSEASAGASGAVAERRLVSIIFADLVGFTPFAEERDSEDVRDVLTRYFDLATSVIERYGGTVEKFIGDAVMAVWGTPTAREDDAERAVRAALDLVDAVRDLSPGVQARCGVLTGEAAVTLNARNQGMVAGDIVNTAARLQSVAAPGTVLVGESTYRAASRAIAFEAAGEQALKGKQSPVPAWRAVRVVAERGGRGRTEALEAPFVGRDTELRLLKDLFHGVGPDRRVRHVSVIGSGGVGKSRLAWEFEKYLDGIAERVLLHQGRSPAYGEGITFWAIGEMIRARAQLNETDDEATTRTKVAAMLDQHVRDDPDRRWIEDALLELLGIRTGAASEELFGAWRTFFERLARTGTVILVFQDLHWADAGTIDFIDHLLEWSRGAPIMILSLSRPELLERRANWGAGQRGFTSLYLEPLTEAAMRELLAGLVPGLPAKTVDAIVARAEGIPLYAIETIRMLVSKGQLAVAEDGTYRPQGDLNDIAVPETLTALVAARLDSLEPADRALLLDAAVLGQSFTPAGLAAISGMATDELDGRLRSLMRRELLTSVADPRSPERGQYQFVQALIREVTYNTLSKRDRKARHLAAARWFESLGEPELAGALAGHYLSARANAGEGPEADALAGQARIALKAAADRAATLGAHRQAQAFLEQALTVAGDAAEIADLHRRAGQSATVVADFDGAEAHFTETVAHARALGDRAAAASATAALGAMLLTGRRIERADAILEPAAAEFADLVEDPARLEILSQLARACFFTGRNERAVELAEEVLGVAERTDQLLLLADTLVTKGSAMANLNRRREALALIDAGGRIGEANGFSNVVMRSINNALSNRTEEDPRAAFDSAAAGLALARRLGQSGWVHALAANYAYVSLRVGEWDTGIAELRAALADTSDALDRLLPLNNLVNFLALRGEPLEEEMTELEAAAALDPSVSHQLYVAECRFWIALSGGRLRAARELLVALAALDRAAGAYVLGLAARHAIWLDDAEGAEADLAGFWAGMGHGGAVWATRVALEAGLAGLRGDRSRAGLGYREALRLIRDLRLPVDEVFLAVDMAYVLGPTDPLTAEVVASARSIVAGLHSKPLMALLDEAVASGPHQRLRASARPGAGDKTAEGNGAAPTSSDIDEGASVSG
jgi:class 3 adenylate cyclase/tetratricopeptide (TPR) repeat protein